METFEGFVLVVPDQTDLRDKQALNQEVKRLTGHLILKF
jgi:hypothetical protein